MRKEDLEERNERRKMFLVYTILNNSIAYLRPGVENNIEDWKNYLEQEYLIIQNIDELTEHKLMLLEHALDTGLFDLADYLNQQSSFIIFQNMGIEDLVFINDIESINEINSIGKTIMFLEEKLENDKINVQKILEYKIR